MPYYPKSEDWLHHSSLLLQAYPETVRPPPSPSPSTPTKLTPPPSQTRITTRYHLTPARRPSKADRAAHKASHPPGTYAPITPTPTTEGETTKPPRGHLVLKTFDPTSGVTLKYKTSKAAEVGRLVQMLGVLGRRMGGLEDKVGGVEEEVGGQGEEMVGVEAAAPAGDKGGAPVGGGDKAGKKKKKGKK